MYMNVYTSVYINLRTYIYTYVHLFVTSNSSCYISSLQDRSKNTRFLRYGENAGNQEGKSTVDNFHHYGLRSKLRALIGVDAALWREGKSSVTRDDLIGSKGSNSNSMRAVEIEVEKEVERGGKERKRGGIEVESRKESKNGYKMYEEKKVSNDNEDSDREDSNREGRERGGGDNKSKHLERGTWVLSEVEQGSVEDADTDHPYGWNEDLDQYGQVRYQNYRFQLFLRLLLKASNRGIPYCMIWYFIQYCMSCHVISFIFMSFCIMS